MYKYCIPTYANILSSFLTPTIAIMVTEKMDLLNVKRAGKKKIDCSVF